MIYHGDLFDVLPTLNAESIDACITDPPYGIGFMGKKWDTFKPDVAQEFRARTVKNHKAAKNPNLKGRQQWAGGAAVEYDYTAAGMRGFQEWNTRWAREVLRVLKPGAYIVVCGAPRSYHRMACGLEDAGFVVRDGLSWLYGQGFPKSLNLGDGRGTALKPSWEPCVLAWKPFKGSIRANVEKFGTGALNIDACRLDGGPTLVVRQGPSAEFGFHGGGARPSVTGSEFGRWPCNVMLDEEAAAMLDEQTGVLTSGSYSGWRNSDKTCNVYRHYGGHGPRFENEGHVGSSGGASRFYYVAKASREERDYGTHGLTERQRDDSRKAGSPGGDNPRNRGPQPRGNFHPTVKPVKLMRWLVKLITPLGGTVLDPFIGSGTTGMACRYEQRKFIGIEREAAYVVIAEHRIGAVAPLFAAGAGA